MEIRFLKHAVARGKKKTRVHYFKGEYTKISGLPKGTITVRAKDWGGKLPKELNPHNASDIMTDYYAKDVARVKPKSKYYKQILKLLK